MAMNRRALGGEAKIVTPWANSEAEEMDEGGGTLATSKGAERRIGELVAGSYRLVHHIGSGGSGDVYEAYHLRLGKRCALKVLRGELATNPLATKRFRREVRAVAHLQSEHIVSVVDCGELDDGTPFFVMELLVGEDLRSLLLKERVLLPGRAAALISDACRGVAAVHQAGLVHRDLKPENLFIARHDDGRDWCKVLDFGVAKMESSLATAQGAIIGTVRYMAPEQLSDPSLVGPAADIYALGAILYECLSGQAAQKGVAVQELMYGILNSPPEPLSALRPELSPQLTSLVHRCLSKAPTERPGAAAQVLAELTAIIARPSAPTECSLTIPDGGLSAASSPRTRLLSQSSWKVVVLAASTALAGWFTARSTPSATHHPASSASASSYQRHATAFASDPAGDIEPDGSNPAPAPLSGEALAPPRVSTHVPSRSPTSGRSALLSTLRPQTPIGTHVRETPPAPIRVGNLDQANPYGE